MTAADLAAPVETVAPRLLGAILRHGSVAVRITEVEAYGGAGDPASHAYRGRTERNGVMFGPPGHLYVYFSHGLHWAGNVVCGPDGTASGALLRAGEVVDGLEVARSRRGAVRDRDLARGPGRLTQALGITRAHRGAYLFGAGPVTLTPAPVPAAQVARGPRVGVSVEADRPWRFWIAGDPYVSAYRRSPRARSAEDRADRDG
ncbi:MAG: DNA-3-methyladenine glycosylase [Actinomycetes bacterium]